MLALYGAYIPEIGVPSVYVAKVARRDGTITQSAVVSAIHWLASRKVTVINLSLGFTGSAKDYKPLKTVIESYPNIFFAAAAGNFGPNRKVYPAAFEAKNLLSAALLAENGELDPHSGKGGVEVMRFTAPFLPFSTTRGVMRPL